MFLNILILCLSQISDYTEVGQKLISLVKPIPMQGGALHSKSADELIQQGHNYEHDFLPNIFLYDYLYGILKINIHSYNMTKALPHDLHLSMF